MTELKHLYREQIMSEAKNPYHFQGFQEHADSFKAYNPICGDKYTLYHKDDEIYFHGFGCILSKASTSMMIRVLEDIPKERHIETIKEFIKAIEGDDASYENILKVFNHSNDFMGRKDCILLSWKALLENLISSK